MFENQSKIMKGSSAEKAVEKVIKELEAMVITYPENFKYCNI
jgi:hypothetical protein